MAGWKNYKNFTFLHSLVIKRLFYGKFTIWPHILAFLLYFVQQVRIKKKKSYFNVFLFFFWNIILINDIISDVTYDVKILQST